MADAASAPRQRVHRGARIDQVGSIALNIAQQPSGAVGEADDRRHRVHDLVGEHADKIGLRGELAIVHAVGEGLAALVEGEGPHTDQAGDHDAEDGSDEDALAAVGIGVGRRIGDHAAVVDDGSGFSRARTVFIHQLTVPL